MRAVSLLTLLNAVGAVLAVVNSVVVARFFGTSRPLEVYFAATTMQYLVFSLTQTGQLGDLLLPRYHRVKQGHGGREAAAVFAAVLNWSLLGTCVIGAVLWFAAPAAMAVLVPGFEPADQALGARMMRAILPLLVVQVAISLLQSLANAERWFGRPEGIFCASQLLTVIAVAALAERLGAWALVWGLWAGQVAQLAGLAAVSYGLGYRHRLVLRHPLLDGRTLLKEMTSTYAYVGGLQVYTFALNAALSLLPSGTYAVYKYVQQLYSRASTVVLRPVSVVFFTSASEALARGGESVAALTSAALRRSFAIAAFSVAAICAGGRPLMAALWGGTRFGPEDLDTAQWILALFGSLLFMEGWGQISRKLGVSSGLARQQYGLGAAVLAASGALVWAAARSFGVPGVLGGAAAAVTLLNLSYLVPIWRAGRVPVPAYSPALCLQWALPMAAGLAAGALGRAAASVAFGTGRVADLATAGAAMTCAVGVMAVCAYGARVAEVRAAAGALRAAAGRMSSRGALA
jgi:putative peptidoglycan lipid II flippase